MSVINNPASFASEVFRQADILTMILPHLDSKSAVYLSLANTKLHKATQKYFDAKILKYKQVFSRGAFVPPYFRSSLQNLTTFNASLKARMRIYPVAKQAPEIQAIVNSKSLLSPVQASQLLRLLFLEKIRAYPATELPSEIQIVVNSESSPTSEQVMKLTNFMQARDTLVVWSILGRSIGVEQNMNAAFVSYESTLEKASGFSNWIEQFKPRLDNLIHLSLAGNQITYLPVQLRQLSKLVVVGLSHFQLTSISEEAMLPLY